MRGQNNSQKHKSFRKFVTMKKVLTFALAILINATLMAQTDSLYTLSFTDISGNEVRLEQFSGKKILFVNVASECGFTGQYEELQQLHEAHGDQVVLIGFPCNQFGGQEPGSAEEIQSFCKKNYGVTFLMASKVDVKGDNQHPIYQWLTTEALNHSEDSTVKWNFEKFLVDENGNFVAHFRSQVNPMSDKIISLL